MEQEDKKQITIACTGWAIHNLVPFSVVSTEGFVNVTEKLVNIGAKYGGSVDIADMLPHRTTVSRNISTIYNHLLPEIKNELQNINLGGVASDIWSDNYKRLAYIYVTINYFLDGKLVDRTIAVKHLDFDKQTAENVLTKLNEIFNCYELDIENFTFVTDRCSNCVAALKNYKRISCSDHIINNILNSSANESVDCKNLLTK